jgi:hypothetical protein
MIISAINRDQAVLDNIVSTLSQMRQGGTPLKPLVMDYTAASVTVSFYVDAAKTILLFSDDSTSHPTRFNAVAGRIIYTPQDESINFAPTPISDRYCLALYYVTATFSDATVKTYTYNNSANLVFQSVVVSSKDNPNFSTNDNSVVVIPKGQKEEGSEASDDYRFILPEYKLILQLVVYDWTNLSEAARLAKANEVNNLIRNALYADRYRGGNSALYDHDLDGTYVSKIELLPSKNTMKAALTVRCAFLATSTTY